jgi:hypothetical protein
LPFKIYQFNNECRVLLTIPDLTAKVFIETVRFGIEIEQNSTQNDEREHVSKAA